MWNNNSGEENQRSKVDFVKYTFIVITMIFVVILYVWQNIEVMKMKMYHRKSIEYTKELVKQRDRLLYEIERYKRPEVIDNYAEVNGLRKASRGDIVRIDID
ncbi:MAG: hypothetical protein PF637_04870 [Spirochaetes bacterium]|jgi:hypothetical protein|nr:hypothetical protein [Spirochaetota bacterium]